MKRLGVFYLIFGYFSTHIKSFVPRLTTHRSYPRIAFVAILFAAWWASGCNPTKRLADDEYLLRKNKFHYIDKPGIDEEAMKSTVRLQPNRKVLGLFRLYLWAWNVPNPDKFEERNDKRRKKLAIKNEKRTAKGKDPKELKPFGSWWRETVGEAPVIFDSVKVARGASQVETYLVKHGYFDATVDSMVSFDEGRQMATVTYVINARNPYIIDSLSFDIPDSDLRIYTERSRKVKTSVKKGDRFDIDKLDEERQRLTAFFRNRGYYDFNKALIYFDVDSALPGHIVRVVQGVYPRKVPYEGDPDSLVVKPYKKYTLRDIQIVDQPVTRRADIGPGDTLHLRGYTIVDHHQLQVKPKVLAQNVLFRTGERYEIDKVTATYRRLSTLPIVAATRIDFHPSSEDINNDSLDAVIRLIPTKKQGLTAEWSGTNQGGYLGISGALGYQNKNIFGGAETLDLRLSGGVEAQRLLTTSEANTSDLGVVNRFSFNTVEIGPEVSLTFPKFVLPIRAEKIAKSANPRTKLTANLSYQKRPDYERTRSFSSIAYQWSESPEKQWQVSPIELSLIKINPTEGFRQRLEEIGDPFLINTYQDHFIQSSRVVYTYNSQRATKLKKNFFFYRGSGETAGSLLRGLFKLTGAPTNEDGHYEILGIDFAHYLKTTHDFRYYLNHNEHMSTVFRVSGGIGKPLKNLEVLPFEKSFFGGGANGIRAWQARTLGPGSYRDFKRSYDKIGDVLIEFNVEYRFDVLDILEGALFVDGGNIWTLHPEPSRPGADFDADRFLSEIAIGAGPGFRFDFDFFIIRLDLGLQLKDPSLDRGERWLFQPKSKYNAYIHELNEDRPSTDQLDIYRPRWNLSLGIGYPF